MLLLKSQKNIVEKGIAANKIIDGELPLKLVENRLLSFLKMLYFQGGGNFLSIFYWEILE